jgi:hypothetical protein
MIDIQLNISQETLADKIKQGYILITVALGEITLKWITETKQEL